MGLFWFFVPVAVMLVVADLASKKMVMRWSQVILTVILGIVAMRLYPPHVFGGYEGTIFFHLVFIALLWIPHISRCDGDGFITPRWAEDFVYRFAATLILVSVYALKWDSANNSCSLLVTTIKTVLGASSLYVAIAWSWWGAQVKDD